MYSVTIKICGITNLEDAQTAVDLGADIIGFNFYPQSPRYIEPARAVAIIEKLPAFVDTAGIFVNADPSNIRELTREGYLNWIQLHGDESPEYCEQFTGWNLKTIKAIRVRSKESLAEATRYRTFAVLLDAYDPARYGGTGERFDWSLLEAGLQPVFLAGGINPDNITRALQQGTFGVDICSGIEASPGKKDPAKMKRLFEQICQYKGLQVIP